MSTSTGRITTEKIYDLVNQMRVELKGDINRLEGKFDQLEAGRLTRLEERFGRMEVKQAISSTKLAILIACITTVSSAIVTVVINQITK